MQSSATRFIFSISALLLLAPQAFVQGGPLGGGGLGSLSGIHIPTSSSQRILGHAFTNTFQFVTSHAPGLDPTALGALLPWQLRKGYNLPAVGGAGAIAIVAAFHYPQALHDLNFFSTFNSLPTELSLDVLASTNTVFQQVFVDSTGSISTTPTSVNVEWNMEAAMAIEWAHALAPNAKIFLVEAASSAVSDLFKAIKVAKQLPGVHQVSISWGVDEWSGQVNLDATLVQNGVTFVAAAGNIAGQLAYPASSANVVAVGGTTLTLGSHFEFSAEVAWAYSGGGLSRFTPLPSFQAGVVSGTLRAGPDVSFNAGAGVAVYYSFTDPWGGTGWVKIGGTSVAAVSISAIANVAASVRGYWAVSTAAELANIYNRFKLGTTASGLRDIVAGGTGLLLATTGFDLLTGVGTPVVGPLGQLVFDSPV